MDIFTPSLRAREGAAIFPRYPIPRLRAIQELPLDGTTCISMTVQYWTIYHQSIIFKGRLNDTSSDGRIQRELDKRVGGKG